MSLLYWDAQNWTQHCRGGPPSAEQCHLLTQACFSCSVLSCASHPHRLVCRCSPRRKGGSTISPVMAADGVAAQARELQVSKKHCSVRCAPQKMSPARSPGRQHSSFAPVWPHNGYRTCSHAVRSVVRAHHSEAEHLSGVSRLPAGGRASPAPSLSH